MNLKSFQLGFTRVSDAGMEYLKPLTNLQGLALCQTEVGDEGLRYLKGMTSLRKLGLHLPRLTDMGSMTIDHTYTKTEVDVKVDESIFEKP